MEAATAEREREIAALQADLGSVRSELERWRSTAAKYEEEISRLQEAFTQQQRQQNTTNQLQGEHGSGDWNKTPSSCSVTLSLSLKENSEGVLFLTEFAVPVCLSLSQRSVLRCSSAVSVCSRTVTT